MKRLIVLLFLPMALANGIALTSIFGAPGYNAMRRHMLLGCYVLAGKQVDAEGFVRLTRRHETSSHLAMLAFIAAVACVDVRLWRAARRREKERCDRAKSTDADAAVSSSKRRWIKIGLALLYGAALGYLITRISRPLLEWMQNQ